MRISDWSSDVCSSDLGRIAVERTGRGEHEEVGPEAFPFDAAQAGDAAFEALAGDVERDVVAQLPAQRLREVLLDRQLRPRRRGLAPELAGNDLVVVAQRIGERQRSEEHTSELQSLMRISYAVFCLKTKQKPQDPKST